VIQKTGEKIEKERERERAKKTARK